MLNSSLMKWFKFLNSTKVSYLWALAYAVPSSMNTLFQPTPLHMYPAWTIIIFPALLDFCFSLAMRVRVYVSLDILNLQWPTNLLSVIFHLLKSYASYKNNKSHLGPLHSPLLFLFLGIFIDWATTQCLHDEIAIVQEWRDEGTIVRGGILQEKKTLDLDIEEWVEPWKVERNF